MTSAISLRPAHWRYVLVAVAIAAWSTCHSPVGATDLTGSSFQPTLMAYQAALSGSDGEPVSNGTYTMFFELLADSAGTVVLWEEPRSVQISDGTFSLYLGKVTPLSESILSDATYLRITINGEVISPPTRLATVPSSWFAGTARSLSGEVVTEGGSLFLPGDNPSLAPKTVELAKDTAGGRMVITGDNGGTWNKQIELAGSSSGGRFGIWGTDGTAMPGAELVIDNGSGMFNLYPGHDWLGGPDTALSMSVDSSGGKLGIWGTNGTSIPQIEMHATSAGGRLGIWGTNGTQYPLAEISGSSGTGSFRLYPGHDWKEPTDTALELTLGTDGGILSIWGTNGTSRKQIEALGTASGGQIGIWGTNGTSFPQVKFGTSTDGGFARFGGIDGENLERVEIDVGDGAGNIGIWGTDGTAYPRLSLYADRLGGTMVLRDTNSLATIMLDGSTWGDAAVRLPVSSINADEMANEPGLVQDRDGSCTDLAGTLMEDIAVVTITIPEGGYIYLTGSGMVEFDGTTTLNRIDVQIDETQGGGATNGFFSRIGLASYGSTSYSSFNFSVNRTFFKAVAGSYTFRLEARRMATNGTAAVCWPVLTAVYLPTSYGTVTTVASADGGSSDFGDGTSSLQRSGTSRVKTTDLRELELRAQEARLRAVQAELDLANARAMAADR